MGISTTAKYLHLASQYLSAAGKSFLEPREDESHTNLAWDAREATLWTEGLNDEGLKLGLNVPAYALDIVHPISGLEASISLAKANHHGVKTWLDREREFCGIKSPYEFDLHYDLPYDESFEDSLLFPTTDGEERLTHAQLRTHADAVLRKVALDFAGKANPAIRIWPHHFDTGLMLPSKGQKGLQFGIGMAMPDQMSEDWYFYISGYDDAGAVAVDGKSSLSNGKWKNEGFKGAVLPAAAASEEQSVNFFLQAIEQYG